MAADSNISIALNPSFSAGDRFELLYRRYRDHVRRHVVQHVGQGPPDPEDVTQAAFMRFAQLENPELVQNPAAFLRATARNIIIDAVRHDDRTNMVVGDLRVLEQNSHDSAVEDVLSARQELERVDAVISRLKPQQRVALLMHRIDEMSFAEIGRQLGLSESGARKLVKKAWAECMRALRQQEVAR